MAESGSKVWVLPLVCGMIVGQVEEPNSHNRGSGEACVTLPRIMRQDVSIRF